MIGSFLGSRDEHATEYVASYQEGFEQAGFITTTVKLV
jgi:hypothetical protein